MQTFGSGTRARTKSATPAVNYLWFREGTISFGKLTMADADLQLIDADAKDPFDFYPARYNEQLVAGYSRNTRALGLKTYMPDFADLRDLPRGGLPLPVHHQSR